MVRIVVFRRRLGGGGGDYCHQDVTADAKRIAADSTIGSGGVKRHKTFHNNGVNLGAAARVPLARTYASRGRVVARSKEKIQYGDVSIGGSGGSGSGVYLVLVLVRWSFCCRLRRDCCFLLSLLVFTANIYESFVNAQTVKV